MKSKNIWPSYRKGPDEKRHMNAYLQLRRCILTVLYRFFRGYPYAQIELGDIGDACDVEIKTLNWNLVYLEKCGYVELAGSIDSSTYVACSASITAAGIDLVENETAFKRRFCIDGDSAPAAGASNTSETA